MILTDVILPNDANKYRSCASSTVLGKLPTNTLEFFAVGEVEDRLCLPPFLLDPVGLMAVTTSCEMMPLLLLAMLSLLNLRASSPAQSTHQSIDGSFDPPLHSPVSPVVCAVAAKALRCRLLFDSIVLDVFAPGIFDQIFLHRSHNHLYF